MADRMRHADDLHTSTERAREREEGYRRYSEILERRRAARPGPETLLLELIREVARITADAHCATLSRASMSEIEDEAIGYDALARVRERMR